MLPAGNRPNARPGQQVAPTCPIRSAGLLRRRIRVRPCVVAGSKQPATNSEPTSEPTQSGQPAALNSAAPPDRRTQMSFTARAMRVLTGVAVLGSVALIGHANAGAPLTSKLYLRADGC